MLAAALAVAGPLDAGPGATAADLVVVTEDVALNPAAGCDAVSVFAASGQALYRGERVVSPGRLTASADLSLVIANHANLARGDANPFLYLVRGDAQDRGRWTPQGRVGGARLVARAGLALLPDGDTLLVSTSSDAAPAGEVRAPFSVRKYRLAEIGAGRLGPARGALEVDGPVVEIFPTAGGRLAHAVTENATLYTLDVGAMTQAAAPVRLPPFDTEPAPGPGRHLNLAHAAITPDGRFVVTSRWRAAELGVADIVDRRAFTLSLGAGAPVAGGLAVNHAAANHGLLAVHIGDAVAVYRFAPLLPRLELLGRAPVARLPIYPGAEWGPAPSLAWTGDGGAIVAATSEGPAEFRVFTVGDGGRAITPGLALAACPDGINRPNDILTANQAAVPPTPPSPTITPSPTLTPSITPTPEISPTPTDTPTITPTPEASATPTPASAFLPIGLREQTCRPERLAVDVVLAIDASLSMGQLTPTGRSKLDAAREAARQFVERLLVGGGTTQAAIVAFNAAATLVQPLTGDRAALRRGLDAISMADGTCIGCGIAAARAELRGPRQRPANAKVIVLLTDGRSNGEDPAEAVAQATGAHADGTQVFTIGLGDDVDRAVLVQIASQREYYYQAPDAGQLIMIYQDIVQEIPCPPSRYWGGR